MAVARQSGLIVGCHVARYRDWEAVQPVVDHLPPARYYCSDAAPLYADVAWPPGGQHLAARGKSETYTIESLNANLRTYLGRLKRRSRCFSRCIDALQRAVRLFVWHYNRRQRVLLTTPHYRNVLSLVF